MNKSEIARQLFVKMNKSIPIKDEWISAALAKQNNNVSTPSASIDFVKQLYPYV